jgi:hypothetical protein
MFDNRLVVAGQEKVTTLVAEVIQLFVLVNVSVTVQAGTAEAKPMQSEAKSSNDNMSIFFISIHLLVLFLLPEGIRS